MTVVDVCPICRKGTETAIKSLANIANQSLHQQQNVTETDGPSEVSREVTDDDEALTSTVDGNVEQVVQNLTLQIMALNVASPPAQPLSPARVNVVSTPRPSTQRRPPHCSTCGHLKQGHQRPVAQGTLSKCLLSHAREKGVCYLVNVIGVLENRKQTVTKVCLLFHRDLSPGKHT